ncbi:MAG: hypothetical protein QOJ89_450 [bacterium]
MRETSGVRALLSLTAAVVALFVGAGGAAGAQQAAGLSSARFAALDSVYTAFVALDGSGTSAAAADVRRVCDALDRSDRLLAITRTACLAALRLAPARESFASCQTPRACSRGARRVRIAYSRTIRASRASNRVVAGELRPSACRRELTVAHDQLRSMQKLRDGMRLLERALLTRRRADTLRAEQLIADSVTLAQQQPTTRQARTAFRGACAPT